MTRETASPGPSRLKVQDPRTECEEVGPIAEVFRDDHASGGPQDAAQLREERAPRLIRAEFVCGKQKRGVLCKGAGGEPPRTGYAR